MDRLNSFVHNLTSPFRAIAKRVSNKGPGKVEAKQEKMLDTIAKTKRQASKQRTLKATPGLTSRASEATRQKASSVITPEMAKRRELIGDLQNLIQDWQYQGPSNGKSQQGQEIADTFNQLAVSSNSSLKRDKLAYNAGNHTFHFVKEGHHQNLDNLGASSPSINPRDYINQLR